MTPAINLAKKNKISHTIHQYEQDPSKASYGLEAAQALGQDPKRVFKTLLFCMNGEEKSRGSDYSFRSKLNLKLAAKAAKAKSRDGQTRD